ncbi:hypothetical protein [Rhizosaccharibacter radicis]|uniref:ATP-dependent DNA ligase family profile domain-containing protein n=1 Tax=Rhizosaccharibacter radicis TaxID=2782605 RepID=A0ABT1W0D8_9PROT|nr:hypothetical protein [Acetobacteraceae bacterium KSS12]
MAMKSRQASSFVMFDVIYEDGSRSSNRRVPTSALGGLDGDDAARPILEAQDAEIAQASGRPRHAIRSLSRTPPRPVEEDPKGARKKPRA